LAFLIVSGARFKIWPYENSSCTVCNSAGRGGEKKKEMGKRKNARNQKDLTLKRAPLTPRRKRKEEKERSTRSSQPRPSFLSGLTVTELYSERISISSRNMYEAFKNALPLRDLCGIRPRSDTAELV
jgi:ribosome-binding protein aMBF1 (putative translation factor)